jgi:Tfp pilus assembly protein PilO
MRSNKLLIGVVALVAAAGAYWFLLLTPKREEAATLSEQVSTKQSEIREAESTLAGYRAAEKTFKVNYATVARLGKAVPADDDVRSLMVQLEHAAAESHVDFRSIAVAEASAAAPGVESTGTPPPPGSKPVGSAGFAVMPFTMEFSGSYLQLSKFFTRLEDFVAVRNGERLDVRGRLLRVESISMAPSDTGFPKLTAQVAASTYLTPESEGLTGGATPSGPASSTTSASAAADDGSGQGTPVTPATVTGALR